MFRSILAVAAGYAAMALAVMLGSAILRAVFSMDTRDSAAPATATLPMVLELIWALPSAILGGYLTGRVARRAPRAHAAALAAIVLVLAIGFALIESGGAIPLWFRVLLPLAAVAGVLIGGQLVRPKPPVGP